MDVITHVLSAAVCTEPLRSPPTLEGSDYPRWRDRVAVVLGASIMDLDGCLGWIGRVFQGDMTLYAKHHRVYTHSILGLAILAGVSALVARSWPERWLFSFFRPRRAPGLSSAAAPFGRLYALAAVAAALHFVGDWITAWGTLQPFWPFSDIDHQLRWVNSLEPTLLVITLSAWSVQNQLLTHGKRRWAWAMACVWLVACLAFIAIRPYVMRSPYV